MGRGGRKPGEPIYLRRHMIALILAVILPLVILQLHKIYVGPLSFDFQLGAGLVLSVILGLALQACDASPSANTPVTPDPTQKPRVDEVDQASSVEDQPLGSGVVVIDEPMERGFAGFLSASDVAAPATLETVSKADLPAALNVYRDVFFLVNPDSRAMIPTTATTTFSRR